MENRFQFTGEYVDEVTGFTYLRARHLDNVNGRFISTDPFEGSLESPISQHRFQYANNNPLAFTDPSGQVSLTETLTVLGGISTLAAIGLGVFSVTTGFSNAVKFEGTSASLTFSPLPNVGVGIQGNVFGSTNLPTEDRFGNSSGLGTSLTFIASVSTGDAISLLGPFSVGIGGFTVFVPRSLVSSNPGNSIAFTYLLIDSTVANVVGETLSSVLLMGFGIGNANGDSISSQVGGSISVTTGFTIPISFSGTNDRTANLAIFRLGVNGILSSFSNLQLPNQGIDPTANFGDNFVRNATFNIGVI